RRNSGGSHEPPTEKFICARRIPERFFRWARNTNRKARSSRRHLTRSCFRSGAASSGGARQRQTSRQKQRRRASSRGWSFLCAVETQRTQGRNGRGGLGRTRRRERRWKRRQRDSCSGKR